MAMNGTLLLKALGNGPREYSPITMNTTWSTLWRLILIFFSAFIGTVTNGFFVAAFFIEKNLRTIGNVYLACSGLADMIITTSVIPTSIVVLMSGQWDKPEVCQAVQILTQAATYSYSLLFMMVSFETYYRLCRAHHSYRKFKKTPVVTLTLGIFLISFAVSAFGVYNKYDYDYCTREHHGDYSFRLLTLMFMHVLPGIIILTLLVSTILVVKARARKFIHYRRSQQYDRDCSFTNLNIFSYCLFVFAWTPYMIVVTQYPNSPDSTYYNCAWIGISRAMLTSFIFSGMNEDFRNAFTHLFYYCCCKSSITAPFVNRHRRAFQYRVTAGEIKVHLIHHTMMVGNCPPRAGVARERREHHALEL